MEFYTMEPLEIVGDMLDDLIAEAAQYGLTPAKYIDALCAMDDDYMASNGHLWD